MRRGRKDAAAVLVGALVVGAATAGVPMPASARTGGGEEVLLLAGNAIGVIVSSTGGPVTELASVGSSSGFFRSGDLSEDGRLIAVSDDADVVVANVDGSCPITVPRAGDFHVNLSPTIAPDTGAVAYGSAGIRNRFYVNEQVEVFDLASRSVRIVGRDGSGDRSLGVRGSNPAWSPSADQIAYFEETSDPTQRTLRLVDAGTGGARTLGTFADGGGGVSWSVDGTALFFMREEGAVWRLDITDGSKLTKILEGNTERFLQDAARLPERAGDDRYRTVSTAGVVRDFGPRCGPGGHARQVAGLSGPAVDVATNLSGTGSWVTTSSGSVGVVGAAPLLGDLGGRRLTRPVVGITGTPTDGGYRLVASDGGVFAFGDAPFLGSTGGRRLNQPVVGMATTTTGDGYWLVASDGGIFSLW